MLPDFGDENSLILRLRSAKKLQIDEQENANDFFQDLLDFDYFPCWFFENMVQKNQKMRYLERIRVHLARVIEIVVGKKINDRSFSSDESINSNENCRNSEISS